LVSNHSPSVNSNPLVSNNSLCQPQLVSHNPRSTTTVCQHHSPSVSHNSLVSRKGQQQPGQLIPGPANAQIFLAFLSERTSAADRPARRDSTLESCE
jgi:hypothetical protein